MPIQAAIFAGGIKPFPFVANDFGVGIEACHFPGGTQVFAGIADAMLTATRAIQFSL